MIDWRVSRYIIDIPWLHDILGFLFLLVLLLYCIGVPYFFYKLTRTEKSKTVEWSFEGKPWSYWKTRK